MEQISVGAFPLGAPLYKEVKRKMTDAVRNGEWKPGDVIPSEKKLCERFGVSMGTVRKAVDELSAEGVLIRQQGRGTFVARHSQDRYLFSYFHIVRQDGVKEYPQVELVEFGRVKANAEAATRLGADAGARLLRVVNLLSIGGEPVVIDEISIPESLFPRLTEKRLRERRTTLYQLYQDEFDITVVRTVERVRAVKADAAKARLLGVKLGDPLLHVIRVALSFKDQPVELRHSYVATERYEYQTELVGGRD
jgi:GntR family transcriptional regulator